MFPDSRNIHYLTHGRDNLPKEIRGKARWTLLENRDWSYVIYAEGKPRSVEYINEAWYRTAWSKETGRYFMNSSQRIRHPEQFRLGTKTTPILLEVDQKHLQGVPSTEETQDGQEERLNTGKAPEIAKADDDQEEGTSTRILSFLDQETLKRVLHRDLEEDTCINNELSTLIEKVEMTTTATVTKAAQQTAEAYIREGGPIDENPMRPLSAITSKVRTLQGQNLYSQGSLTRTDNVQLPQRTFGSRNPGGGPPEGGPPGRAPRRDLPGGSPPKGNSPRGGSPARRGPDDNDCQRDQTHMGKISSHINIFDGDRTKVKKFQMEFGLAQITNLNHQNMRVPMQRVALALSYIKGEDVDEWCHGYADKLAEEVYC